MGKLLIAALVLIMVAAFKASYNQRLMLVVLAVGILLYMRAGKSKKY